MSGPGVLPFPNARGAMLPLIEARMDRQTRHATFRPLIRKRIAAMFRVRAAALSAAAARDMAVVVLQLMKAASALGDEEGLPSGAARLRELQALTVHCLEQRRHQPRYWPNVTL